MGRYSRPGADRLSIVEIRRPPPPFVSRPVPVQASGPAP